MFILNVKLIYSKQERNETEEQMKRFYGPPHNCAELGMLGYTLNGYYLVKRKGQFNKSKIHTVYCQFKNPPIVKNCRGDRGWVGQGLGGTTRF